MMLYSSQSDAKSLQQVEAVSEVFLPTFKRICSLLRIVAGVPLNI